MYKPLIKEKHALIDLSKFGTKARKSVHPDVLIGEHPSFPMFKEGDILDANATFNLIQCTYDQGKVYNSLSSLIQLVEDRVKKIEQSSIVSKEYIDSVINEITTTHNQDIQNINAELEQILQVTNNHNTQIQQIKNELNEFAISYRFVYDGLEENLMVIK